MAMQKWVQAQTEKTKDQALGELARMPSYGEPGHVRTLFPKIDRDAYQQGVSNEEINTKIDNAPIQDVPLVSLIGIQASVSRERVASFIKDPNQLPKGKLDADHGGIVDHPVVVQKGDMNFLHDGHHRATAAKLMGKQTIQARVIRVASTPGFGGLVGNPGSQSASGVRSAT